MNIVELSTGRTVHLFDGSQLWPPRSLCGRVFESLHRPLGEPVCVTCINAENAREGDDTVEIAYTDPYA